MGLEARNNSRLSIKSYWKFKLDLHFANRKEAFIFSDTANWEIPFIRFIME